MVAAMVLGGLRRCEVLGLRLEDLRPGERRVFVAEGKGGHQRFAAISARFFRSVGAYMDTERPSSARTERVFVVLKGPRAGEPLSEDGLEEIVRAARARAGLAHASCHELRHNLLHAAARSRHGLGGITGPGWAPVDRDDTALPPPSPTSGWPTSTSVLPS